MQKVQARQAGVSQVSTMSVDVKPPVSDAYNTVATPKPVERRDAQPQGGEEPKPGTQGPDFDKFKTIMSASSRPKNSGQP
jgi:hypothetical protein